MSDKIFYEVYREAEQELRDECDELVRRGEMSQEDADFRFLMVRIYTPYNERKCYYDANHHWCYYICCSYWHHEHEQT